LLYGPAVLISIYNCHDAWQTAIPAVERAAILGKRTISLTHTDIDLSSCENEPIHLIGSIQPHGFLLTVTGDGLKIVHCSTNTGRLLGVDHENLLGKTLDTIVEKNVCREIKELADCSSAPKMGPFRFAVKLGETEDKFVAVTHRSGDLIVFEAEPERQVQLSGSTLLAREITSGFRTLFSAGDAAELLKIAAEEISRLSGFDRVLVYRFDEDWNGTVVAEVKQNFSECFLNHKFPASDIPKQARELYTRNWIRLLVDVDETPVPVVTDESAGAGSSIDLSYSILRSMSPIHKEYLKNMGVKASMSISVVRDGQLWALIACHQRQAKLIDHETRSVCELVGVLVSRLIVKLEESQETQYLLSLEKIQQLILHELSLEEDMVDGLIKNGASVLKLTNATGFAVCFQGRLALSGKTPTETEVLSLIDWLKSIEASDLVETKRLSALFAGAEGFSSSASGLLAVPIARHSGDWLLWFRPEVVEEVLWAGNPAKPVTAPEPNMRIHPRKSFETWKEQVHGMSKPWLPSEKESAKELGKNLLDFVLGQFLKLRQAEYEIQKQKEKLQEQREDWFAALAHDLCPQAVGASRLLEMLTTRSIYSAEEQMAMLRVLRDSQNRQLERISMLLDVFRYQMTPGQVSAEPADLQEIVRECLDEFDPIARAKGIRLSFVPGEKAGSLRADNKAIRRLVANLLDNAIKFSFDNQAVEISLESQKDNVYLHVRDSGPGIPVKDQPFVFKRFWQGGSAKGHVSVGLGLYLCLQIVTNLGGRISFKSDEKSGTVFSVSLPLQTDA
jgi:two-component system, chemotaxis family, sensor kinase Cph1